MTDEKGILDERRDCMDKEYYLSSERREMICESWITPTLCEIQALKRSPLWDKLSERAKFMYNGLERGKLAHLEKTNKNPVTALDTVGEVSEKLGRAYRE